MVLRGKHGNSSNFADPPHTNHLKDKSSELKHVYGPVVILCGIEQFILKSFHGTMRAWNAEHCCL